MKHTEFKYGDKFLMKCPPLRTFFGISFVTSTDEMTEVVCTLQPYSEGDTLQGEFSPYKVKLIPDDKKYASESFYWQDFTSLIKEGNIKHYLEQEA